MRPHGSTGESPHGSRAERSRGLTAEEMESLSPYIPGVDLVSAVVHIGRVPWYLPRRFSAITRGRHIYFRAGVYRQGTVHGIALLGHELTHVGQYRSGMTAVRYLWSALGGYMNSRYERAAYAVQARIVDHLSGRPPGDDGSTP